MREKDYPGRFIVVEGPDASGKQTQTSRLAEWLREEDISSVEPGKEKEIVERMPGKYPAPDSEDDIVNGVWRLSFPTYSQTPGGRVVEAYLNGRLGDRDELEIRDIVDIYAADRKQFKSVMEDYLNAGGIIVCDRYREANLIHQLVGFEGEKWHKMLSEIKKSDRDLPDADRIIYLDISPEEALKRMKDKKKDIHELDTGYMEASNRNGLKVARHENWGIVNAERSRDQVENEIRSIVREEVL